jgi:hypothetical protein
MYYRIVNYCTNKNTIINCETKNKKETGNKYETKKESVNKNKKDNCFICYGYTLNKNIPLDINFIYPNKQCKCKGNTHKICIQKWLIIKPVCPLCNRTFNMIPHNFGTNKYIIECIKLQYIYINKNIQKIRQKYIRLFISVFALNNITITNFVFVCANLFIFYVVSIILYHNLLLLINKYIINDIVNDLETIYIKF